MANWKLGDLELNSADGYKIFKLSFPDHSTTSSLSPRRGSSSWLSDIKPDPVKVQMSGLIVGYEALVALAAYDVSNFDWMNCDTDIYLTQEDTRRWKVQSFMLNYIPDAPLSAERFDFVATIILASISPEGVTARTKTGSGSGDITGLTNTGSKDAPFESIGITATGRVTAASLNFSDLGQIVELAPQLLDGAQLTLYPKQKLAHHIAEDNLSDPARWTTNLIYSAETSFANNRIVFANDGILDVFYYLNHPLIEEPKLTLSASDIVGTPKLEVAKDWGTWTEVGTIIAGTQKYTLDKVYGWSWFYWRLICGAADSMKISYIKLDSWHSISGQPEVYVSAGATDETVTLSYSGGSLAYNLKWYDNHII